MGSSDARKYKNVGNITAPIVTRRLRSTRVKVAGSHRVDWSSWWWPVVAGCGGSVVELVLGGGEAVDGWLVVVAVEAK